MASQRVGLLATGFEFGLFVSGASKLFAASNGTWAVQGTTKRSGSYALKGTPVGGTLTHCQMDIPVVNNVILRFYVRFDTLPDADWWLFSLRPGSLTRVQLGFGFHQSTGKIRPGIHDEGTSTEEFGSDGSISVSTGVWYRIDAHLKQVSSSTSKIEWQMAVEGEAGTTETTYNSSAHSVTSTWQSVIFGDRYGSAADGVAYFDDVVAVVYNDTVGSKPEYPIGDGRVCILVPASDGTHSNAADFTDDLANSPPASFFDRLDEIPVTDSATGDYIFQDTIGTTSYLEANLTNTPSDWASGVNANAAIHRHGFSYVATGNASHSHKMRDTINSTEDIATTPGAADTNKKWVTAVYDPAGTLDSGMSKAVFDAMVLRSGFSPDVTPNIRVHDSHIEIDYPYTAVTDNDGWGWGEGQERWHYL